MDFGGCCHYITGKVTCTDVALDVLFAVDSDKYVEPCELSPELAAIVGEPRVSAVLLLTL